MNKIDYLRTQYKNRVVKEPKKANPGKSNPAFKHGGYCIELLSDEEKEYYQRERERYMYAYPFLKEPAMEDLLNETILLKIRIQRLQSFVLSPHTPIKETLAPTKLLDQLQRTLSLLITRMGLTYVSRQRRKQKVKRKTPLELITEDS